MKAGPLSDRLGPQARERMAGVCMAFLVGAVPPLMWWMPQQPAMALLEEELARMRNRVHADRVVQTPPSSTVPETPDWPLPEESTRVWNWLQQGAQAHGLQVQALQALPLQVGADLPEQPVRLRLLGAWPDWLTFVAALDAQAPWWVVDQWQVVPDGQMAGKVRIDVQARVGLQPSAARTKGAMPRVWPEWQRVSASPGAGVQLFALPHVTGPAAARAPAAPQTEASEALPPDPRLWPVQQLQLLGVWWQAGVAHAVLGRGLAQVTVSNGQRIGHEAYQVLRISAAGVELQAPGAAGRQGSLTLTWSGER